MRVCQFIDTIVIPSSPDTDAEGNTLLAGVETFTEMAVSRSRPCKRIVEVMMALKLQRTTGV